MCFSAEADLVTGLVVCAVGIDALRLVRRHGEWPLAVIPLVLGVHQLVEVFVWLGLEGEVGQGIQRAAVWVYLAIAFGVLPVLVPVAVAATEPAARRRRIAVFTTIGVIVATTLMYSVIRGPVEASIEGHHIAYRVDLWHGGFVVALYVLATCGSMLVSHHRGMRWFGAANLVTVVALAWLDQTAFISLWCAWAAVTSVAIAVHLRTRGRDRGDLGQALADGRRADRLAAACGDSVEGAPTGAIDPGWRRTVRSFVSTPAGA